MQGAEPRDERSFPCKFVSKNMLPKQNRLTKKKDFDVVFKGGESVKNGFLICKVLKNPSTSSGQAKESRFGFVVSKKISNKATVRNKVKRRLRDAVSAHLKGIKKTADVVILTLPGIEKKEFAEIQEMVNGALKKASLI